jgi:uncharacterized protein YqeY
MWNDWCKREYTIKEIQASMDIAFVVGEMGWPSIHDVLDRMVKNRMESIGRFQLSESERDCVEKAMYYIRSTG